MESTINFSIWALLIGFGAFHGIFLALVLFVKKENSKANNLLAFLLLIISFHLIEYIVAISRLYDVFPHILATSYPFLFLMGPLYYFYCRSLTSDDFRLSGMQLFHFVPAVICLLLLMPLYSSGAEEKISFLQSLAAESNIIEIPAGQYLFMGTHLTQMFIYVVLSQRRLNKVDNALREKLSDSSLVNLSVLKSMTRGLFIFLLLFLLVLLLLPIVKFYRVELDYLVLLVLTGLVHAIGYVALRQPAFFNKTISPDPGEKYATYRLPDNQISILYQKIVNRVEKKELYQISDFKISDLSEEMEVPVHYLSQVINEMGGTNFFGFINSFRIQKAKDLLRDPGHSDLKIIAVAFDSGFSNKSTFNRIFKKHTGYTPSSYREKFINSNS